MLFTRLSQQQLSRYLIKPAFKQQFGFSQIKQAQMLSFGEVDLGGVQAAIQPPSEVLATDIMTKISYLSPNSIYEAMDVFSRDSLMYIADDLGYGMGIGILTISVAIKLFFSPFMVFTQINGIKMKLIEPETKNFQAQYQKLTQSRDLTAAKVLQMQYKELRSKHNISFVLPLLSMLQIPALMTWFFSLRYITSLPDQYPGIKTQGMLWFKDLSEYDPYGLIPILSATLTFWNISLNPNMSAGTQHPLGRYYRYIRFLPFLSIPIVIFFPAGINLYWCSSAFVQLLISAACRSEQVRKYFGVPQYLPGTILEKLHQNKTQNIVRAVIKEQISEKKKVPIEEIVSGIPLRVGNLDKTQAAKTEQKIQENLETKDKPTVKLYANKPKKNKS